MKQLQFRVKDDSKTGQHRPKWRKIIVEDAECPACHNLMVVILGHMGICYAYCPRCRDYYIGE